MTNTNPILRIRVAVRAVLALGIVASVAANVLHATPTPVAMVIAGWPPVALLLTVELISRVPVHRPMLATGRVAAMAAIAGIAAWVSYWHMASVAARYGETPDSAHLIPLSVDGLVVVASICLVEIGGRLAVASAPTAVAVTPDRVGATTTPTPTGTPSPSVPPPAPPAHDPTEVASPTAAGSGTTPPVRAGGAPAEDAAVDLADAADQAMVKRLQRDIAASRVKASPGVEVIRKHLKVGNDRARRLRDLLQAETPAATGRHATRMEGEAADA